MQSARIHIAGHAQDKLSTPFVIILASRQVLLISAAGLGSVHNVMWYSSIVYFSQPNPVFQIYMNFNFQSVKLLI